MKAQPIRECCIQISVLGENVRKVGCQRDVIIGERRVGVCFEKGFDGLIKTVI